MDKKNEKTPIWREPAEVLTKTVMLNEDELQQVSGGGEDKKRAKGCKKNCATYCGDTPPCEDCPNLRLPREPLLH